MPVTANVIKTPLFNLDSEILYMYFSPEVLGTKW